MEQARRDEYLKALGIDVFVPRRQHARVLSRPDPMEQAQDPCAPAAPCSLAGSVVVGPGAGNLLLLCASPAEAATPLAADIARCLDCEPVWSWPANADSANPLPLELAVAERLFTRVIIFGSGLTWPKLEVGARVIGSAHLLQADPIPVLARSASARKALWAEISANNWCAPRNRA